MVLHLRMTGQLLDTPTDYPEEKCMDLEDDDWVELTESIKKIIRRRIEINEMTAEEYFAGKEKNTAISPT